MSMSARGSVVVREQSVSKHAMTRETPRAGTRARNTCDLLEARPRRKSTAIRGIVTVAELVPNHFARKRPRAAPPAVEEDGYVPMPRW